MCKIFKNIQKYIVDVGLAVSFLVAVVTGIIKFPGLLRRFGIHFSQLPMREISFAHDWAGIIMAILVFVHLVQHWNWIVAMTKRIFIKK